MNAAVAEALADPRVGPVDEEELRAEAARWDEVELDVADATELDAVRRGRPIEWATRTLTQGEVFDAFGAYCREELDDVEVLDATPSRLELGWRRERSTIELRAGFLFAERLAGEGPALLLGQLGPRAVDRFLADEALRSRIAVLDLTRLEKIAAVRSSVFVYFEWFLRDEYGVKILPEQTFTTGLVERGIISLGMG
ncbi:MAG TPA: hypothetical protein VFA24_01885 [Gaiellaceae bacterium]|nr:hypothetical protein [Gaiellaceae bacterium]